jgi:hypothetical protein
MLHGPRSFPTVTLLRNMLREVPEQGMFTMGGTKVLATEQLRLFQEAGLQVPEFTTNRYQANAWVINGFTVLGRKENHTQGRDIIIATGHQNQGTKQRRRWQARQWWCKFVPSTGEWRIHVFDGRTIARAKKEPGPGSPGMTQVPIRSRRNGWLYRHDLEPSEALRTAARGAVAALGYPYGAVDLLETPDGPVVLEVNRLPAMDNYTATAYVNAIRRHVVGRKVAKLPTARRTNDLYEGVLVV